MDKVNRDPHKEKAAEIFEIPEEQVTEQQRRIAKTINFGCMYGASGYLQASVLTMGKYRKED